MNVFDEMGKYWAEIADQDQTQKQVEMVKKTIKPGGLVLDLACGTGRHMTHLIEAGYAVVGLDISKRLLNIAKRRFKGADLVRADMRFLPFVTESFSAAISMDTSFGYLASQQDDVKSLKEVNSALRTGSTLVVDVFNRENLIKKYETRHQPKWKEYPSFFLLQKRSVTVGGEELHDEWIIRDKSDGRIRVFRHVARLYELSQLQTLVQTAGFAVIEIFGDYEKQKLLPDSDRLILVACST